ncbi:MAG: MBOAT family protein [Abditibacteriota bacterium]|nr:MBOAT family protein [Abditibacteriota bacterium]
MLFNSIVFVIFAVVFFIGWYLLRNNKSWRWVFLIAASLFFYGWWDWRYVILLVGTGFVDYTAAIYMEKHMDRKKLILCVSMLGNLGVLLVFKYLGFAESTINSLFSLLGINMSLPVHNLLLPVGISFYTFESLSYTVDVYRGHCKPTHNILKFFSFLSLFPHLVAGPVVRPYDLLPQIEANKPPTDEQKWDGMRLISHGFFKKMVIADTLAPAVNKAFSTVIMNPDGIYWWIVAAMFSLQIYCDFSGYTDIARGLAKWMGYEFPINFNHPYISASAKEFWTRWHISLSSWFRDYVYIPLGGSRNGKFNSHKNMWITMLVSGLWHGAAWHFVVWGTLHAFYTSFERITKYPIHLEKTKFGKFVSVVITMALVTIAWVFFRAEHISQALTISKLMLTSFKFDMGSILSIDKRALAVCFLMILWELRVFFGLEGISLKHKFFRVMEPVTIALIFTACVFLRGNGDAFIYFQF